jgi:inner membrane transporter RhtA
MRMVVLLERMPAPLLALLAIILIQLGSGLAKDLMSGGGPIALLLLRSAIGSVLLLPFLANEISHLNRTQWRNAALLGVSFVGFSVSAYWALANLPLGLVATIGFLGPLSISLLGARSIIGYVWPSLGVIGVLLLSPMAETTLITVTGLLYGLLYAAMWAAYILMSAKVAKSLPGLTGFALATIFATFIIAPFGIPNVSTYLTSTNTVLTLLAIAVLSTYPFAMEFLVLRRMPPKVYGVLLSSEPAIAAIIGMLLLAEYLSGFGWIAVALITLASIGAAITKSS